MPKEEPRWRSVQFACFQTVSAFPECSHPLWFIDQAEIVSSVASRDSARVTLALYQRRAFGKKSTAVAVLRRAFGKGVRMKPVVAADAGPTQFNYGKVQCQDATELCGRARQTTPGL
jgi:hypothetical protein